MNVKKELHKYLNKFPTSIPPGHVMMHNHVRRTIDMPLGLNGFRAWTDTAIPNNNFKPCECGWSGPTPGNAGPNSTSRGVPLHPVRLRLTRDEALLAASR